MPEEGRKSRTLNRLARILGRKVRRELEKPKGPLQSYKYIREGSRMKRVPVENTMPEEPRWTEHAPTVGTGTGYLPSITGKKNRAPATYAGINAAMVFFRHLGWLPWEPSQDLEMVGSINVLVACVHGAWVTFWDIKRAWYDKRKQMQGA